MNKEIKEILDRLEYDKDDVYYVGYTDGVNIDNTLMPKDIKLLLDYITNLQESEAYYYGQYKDYKSRKEKAVEYIKINFVEDIITVKTLLNILNGRSDE